jgi:hypothetical protein
MVGDSGRTRYGKSIQYGAGFCINGNYAKIAGFQVKTIEYMVGLAISYNFGLVLVPLRDSSVV